MFIKLVKRANVVLLIAGVMTSLLLLSCSIVKWNEFVRDESEVPIVMFGRYSVDFWSYAWPAFNSEISFTYLTELKDTTSIDTLPILTLDSICFIGSCFDNSACVQPVSWRESSIGHGKEPQQNGVIYLRKGRRYQLLRYEDLFYIDRKVVPQGYEYNHGGTLPQACAGTKALVRFSARLLDRATGKEIAQETKEVPFMIQEKKKLGME